MSFFDSIKRGLVRARDFSFFGKNQFLLFLRRFIKEQHQLTSTTSSDRYPELFSEVRSSISHAGEDLSILSFGCSTGEECFTMKSYFPRSKITGVDINKRNLKKAASKNKCKDIKFKYSTSEIIAHHGKYHLIFGLSVLCRWEDTKDLDNCGDIYPFKKFSETVEMLATQLKPGGLLIVYNSNFRFEDTSAFADFEIVPTPSVRDSGFVHKFDSFNNRIREEHKHCIYRKKAE